MIIETLVLVKVGIVALGIGAAATFIFWKQVLNWTQESLLPWFRRHLPTFEPYIREGIVAVDSVVVSVQSAWRQLRTRVLNINMKIYERSQNQWVRSVTSWIIRSIEEKKVVEVTTEVDIDWEDLPAEFRRGIIQHNDRQHEIKVTDMLDQQNGLVME